MKQREKIDLQYSAAMHHPLKLISPEAINSNCLDYSWSCVAGQKLTVDLFGWRKEFWEHGLNDDEQNTEDATREVREAIEYCVETLLNPDGGETKRGLAVGFLDEVATILIDALALPTLRKNAERRFAESVQKQRRLDLAELTQCVELASSISPSSRREEI